MAQGFSLVDVDDVEFQSTNNLCEVDEAICNDGRSYEMHLNQNFNIIFKDQDD